MGGRKKRCSCGYEIEFGEVIVGPDERTVVPLDFRAPVYRIIRRDAGNDLIVVRDRRAVVSHFATCPDASKHSRRGR